MITYPYSPGRVIPRSGFKRQVIRFSRHTLLMFSRGGLWKIKPQQIFTTFKLPSAFRTSMWRLRALGSRPLLLRSDLLWFICLSLLLSYLGLWSICLSSLRSGLLWFHARLRPRLLTNIPLPHLLKLRLRYSLIMPFSAMPTMLPIVISPS